MYNLLNLLSAITPTYMCATQTTWLKQPKVFYSAAAEISADVRFQANVQFTAITGHIGMICG